jgi:hypothetical protein
MRFHFSPMLALVGKKERSKSLPPHAADDLVHFYDPSPSVEAVASHEAPSSDVVEGEQPV